VAENIEAFFFIVAPLHSSVHTEGNFDD